MVCARVSLNINISPFTLKITLSLRKKASVALRTRLYERKGFPTVRLSINFQKRAQKVANDVKHAHKTILTILQVKSNAGNV